MTNNIHCTDDAEEAAATLSDSDTYPPSATPRSSATTRVTTPKDTTQKDSKDLQSMNAIEQDRKERGAIPSLASLEIPIVSDRGNGLIRREKSASIRTENMRERSQSPVKWGMDPYFVSIPVRDQDLRSYAANGISSPRHAHGEDECGAKRRSITTASGRVSLVEGPEKKTQDDRDQTRSNPVTPGGDSTSTPVSRNAKRLGDSTSTPISRKGRNRRVSAGLPMVQGKPYMHTEAGTPGGLEQAQGEIKQKG